MLCTILPDGVDPPLIPVPHDGDGDVRRVVFVDVMSIMGTNAL